jgi:hypothetical protein
MPRKNAIQELEASISRYYEKYSARKVATAAAGVGVFTFGLSYLSYVITTTGWIAIIVFGLVGLVSINLSLIFIVPPSSKIRAASELIFAAIREPSRIKAFDINGVKLADKEGNVHTLSGVDLEVWRNMVIPYFVQSQASGHAPVQAREGRRMTASERKYIEQRRREVLEIEQKLESERKLLERKRMEMDSRSQELKDLERTVTAMMAKAEKIDSKALDSANAEREAEFKKREAELQKLQEQIQRESAELEERSQYVTSVEDSLVEKMNELTAREASLEMGEINAGLRSDD